MSSCGDVYAVRSACYLDNVDDADGDENERVVSPGQMDAVARLRMSRAPTRQKSDDSSALNLSLIHI